MGEGTIQWTAINDFFESGTLVHFNVSGARYAPSGEFIQGYQLHLIHKWAAKQIGNMPAWKNHLPALVTTTMTV